MGELLLAYPPEVTHPALDDRSLEDDKVHAAQPVRRRVKRIERRTLKEQDKLESGRFGQSVRCYVCEKLSERLRRQQPIFGFCCSSATSGSKLT
jgi:hypothetical protein